MLATTPASGARLRGKTAYKIAAPSAHEKISTQTAACVVIPAASNGR